MNREYPGHGLELHHHDVINEQVDPIPGADPYSSVLDRERKLRPDLAPTRTKLVRKAGGIGAYESITRGRVSGAANLYRKSIDLSAFDSAFQASTALQRTRDYQQQADLYQAAAEVINESPVGSGRVMGLLSWGYTWTDQLVTPSWAFDRSANVRGKPAEAVLRWWFDRW